MACSPGYWGSWARGQPAKRRSNGPERRPALVGSRTLRHYLAIVRVPAASGWTCVVAAGETLGECVVSGPMVFVTAIILALTTGFTKGFRV